MSARILAVHDRERSQAAIKTSLEPMHAVTVCSGIANFKEKVAEDAESNSGENQYDLIVCAIHISDSDNGNVIDFLKWTRANVRLKNIPFLLLATRHGLIIGEFLNGLRTASSELGAAGLLLADDIAGSRFLRDIEEYLPGQLRSSVPAEAAN